MSCNYNFEYIPPPVQGQDATPIISSLTSFPCTSGSTVTPYKNILMYLKIFKIFQLYVHLSLIKRFHKVKVFQDLVLYLNKQLIILLNEYYFLEVYLSVL